MLAVDRGALRVGVIQVKRLRSMTAMAATPLPFESRNKPPPGPALTFPLTSGSTMLNLAVGERDALGRADGTAAVRADVADEARVGGLDVADDEHGSLRGAYSGHRVFSFATDVDDADSVSGVTQVIAVIAHADLHWFFPPS